MTSLLAAYCGICNHPYLRGGKPCWAGRLQPRSHSRFRVIRELQAYTKQVTKELGEFLPVRGR
jgi:hypothetical protein